MNNQVVWITGASSGIGEALVYAYSTLGARLIISSRNSDQLLKVQANCANPTNVAILPLDLADLTTLSSKAESALKIYGHIDMLINSGGISQRALAMETTLATEQKLMTVNFWGTVTLTKAILPHLLAQNSGHVVCISSLVGKFSAQPMQLQNTHYMAILIHSVPNSPKQSTSPLFALALSEQM
jgi:dehydrogenase/reductase SDR family protein 7B